MCLTAYAIWHMVTQRGRAYSSSIDTENVMTDQTTKFTFSVRLTLKSDPGIQKVVKVNAEHHGQAVNLARRECPSELWDLRGTSRLSLAPEA